MPMVLRCLESCSKNQAVKNAGKKSIENLDCAECNGIKKSDKNKQNKNVESAARSDGICP